MGVYILLTLVTCLTLMGVQRLKQKYAFAMLGKDKVASQRNVGFLITFLILAFFASVRDGVGCDYESYVMHIQRIQMGNQNYMEIGFQWVCRQIAKIDSNPRLVIIIFAVATCFFYLRAIWDQSEDPLFSVFLFLTWGYYFMTFNTIRNYFALAVAVFAIKYLDKKKYIHFILLIIVSSLFHKSALVCIPLYLLATKKYRLKHIYILLGVLIVAILFKDPIRALMFEFYPSYEGGAYDTGRVSYLNIIKALVVLVLCGLFWDKIKDEKLARIYFNLNLFAFVLYTAFYWIPEISRIGFYMNATTILLLPNLAIRVGKVSKYSVKFLIGAFSVVLFVLLLIEFQDETTRLLPYKTWLFDGSF